MMKSLILVLCLLSLTLAWKTYRGYRTYKVIPQSEEQLKDLRTIYDDIELDVWKTSSGVGDEAHVMVSPEKRLSFAELMVKKGFTLGVHVEDVGDEVAEFKARMDARRKPDGRMDFDLNDYNTVDDTYSQLEAWQAQCPDGVTCEVVNIGSTSEDRTVYMFTMSTGGTGGNIYIDSLTHAREMLSGSTVNNIINKMVLEYGSDADVTRLLDEYDWNFVPIVNPDGYQHALTVNINWRKNREPNSGNVCIGTDLNRNFDTNFWGSDGTSTNPCSDTYGGASAASAPETQIIQDTLTELNAKIMISIHSYANMWLQPFGHQVGFTCARTDMVIHNNMMDAGQAAINAIMAEGEQSWVHDTVCETIYPASGGTVDYAMKTGTLYSYTPELRGNSFNPPTSQIQPAFTETWAGIVALVAETETH